MHRSFVPAVLSLLLFLHTGCARNYFEIRGRVVDAATGKPVRDAEITLLAATRAYSNSSDAGGDFSIRYSVSRNQFNELAAWLLTVEAENYAGQIIPMFQPVRMFGYYRRLEVVFRLVKPSACCDTAATARKGKPGDPLADPEPVRRIHLLSRYVYLDALVRKMKSAGGQKPFPVFFNYKRDSHPIEVPASDRERRNFARALAAHMVADRCAAVRREAARVAWRWESPEIIHALVTALEDRNTDVRYFASRTLERVTGINGYIIYRDDDEETRGEKTARWHKWYACAIK